MSTPNPYTKYAADTPPAEADNPYAKYASAMPAGAADAPKPRRSLMGAINDTVIEAANAAAGTASAVGNFVRPGNAASGWIDKNIIEAGEAKQSDVVKAEKARYAQDMQDAQGVGDEVGATLGYVARNPLLAAAQAAGSFAGPGLAIKGANKLTQAAGIGAKGTTRAGLAAGAALGAAGAGGDAAGTAYELSREGGATDEQAAAAARGASVLPAAIGAAGGLVGAERLVAGAKGFGGGLVSRALKTGAVEGAQEAIEEGVTQYEGQRAAVPFNPDLDPTKGVAGAATMGAVLGAATGAGASVLTGSPQQRVRKPSEDLGLNPENGPLSKVAAAAVDAAPSAQAQTGIAPADGLSLVPEQEAQAPKGPSMAERLAVLPAQARAQADQWLREIADERTPEGVKRFRANELQQLLDANPMPQEPSMDIPEEERIAMRPVVRGFDPATGQAPAQPLGMVDGQYQYEGGVNFEQQPSPERPSSLIELANWYERSDQGTSDAANPLEQVQQQVRQSTQYTDTAQVQAASQAVEDAWLALNAGEFSSPVPPTTGTNYEAVPADTTAETDARVRAGRVSSAVRNAFDSGLPNTLSAIQYVNQGLRTIGEQQLTSAEVARIRRLADARTAFEGLNQPAPLPADRPAMPKDPAADNSGMEALIPERTTRTTGQQAQPTQAVPSITGRQLDGEWHAFTAESGTLGIPRAEMPQVFAEHRGALVGYLKGQGVESQAAEVDATSLKPTQAEFSVEKVRKAMDRKGGDRSILVSADGYVVDGHHQWLAKREAGQPVKVLQLQAPIAQLLPMVSSFPSARTTDGAPTDNTQQGQSNGSPTPIDNAPQGQAPALPQKAGVADAIEATQTQSTGAQPQAQSTSAAEGAGQVEPAPSPATPVARKRTAGDNARARAYDANPMRAFLAKHGVKIDARSEFAPGLQEVRGTLVPGYGPMFRKNGKQLDELVQNAIEEGFLPSGATEAQLYELIDTAVRQGQRVSPMYSEGGAESEFEAMATRRAEFAREDYEADRAAQDAEAAEYEAVLAQEFVDAYSAQELDALEAVIPFDAQSNMSAEDAMRALGFTEQEIQDATRSQQPAQPASTSSRQADGAGATGTQARTGAGQSSQGPSQPEGLSSYSAQEVLARQEAQAKAQVDQVKADREAERRTQADRERSEFTLTGSDRAADANANQGDIFSQPDKPKKQDTQRQSFAPQSTDTFSQATLKASLARAERQKKEAFDRVKRVRQAVKDGTANRLNLLKAEDAHRALVREVDEIKSSVPQFSRSRNLQTETAAFKRWYGDWQNAGDVPEQLEPHRGRAQSSPDGGGAHVNGLQRSSNLDQVSAGTDRTRWITFSGASGPTGEDGTPVRLYHGTKDDIKAFDLSHPGRKDAGWLGDGIYLSSNAIDAEQYSRAKQGGHGPNVMPLYANVRNPYEASRADKTRLKHASKLEIQAFTDDLKSKGHDGVVLWDTGGDMELVAFKPTQVKSATGNNGSFDPANPDIRYSQSAKPATKPAAIQLRRAMVQRAVNALSGAWSQRPSITVVDSMNDSRVPQAVREADQAQRSQGATGEPEGFWYQGQVYLVASALPTSADATRVLYHEVLGHHGLRGHFGGQFDRVLDQVAKLRRKDVEAKAQEYGLDLAKPDHVSYAAEEVLAELAQTRPDLGFVQRAIAAIRNFLREHVPGFKHLALTDADIAQAYLLPARGWVERAGAEIEQTGQARFSFAGERALNADMGNLEAAKRGIRAKESVERVRKETGWHQGVDGKWRYEISDHEATFKSSDDPYEFNIDRVSEGQVRRLSDVIAHDKLFAAYPSLANLPVEFVSDKEFRGAYYRQSDRIDIAIGAEPSAMLSTLLHEIQHAIQAREGFSSGGNMNADFVQRIRLALNALPAQAKDKVDAWVADNQHLVKEANATATIARQALMYESAQRLISYSNRESPSGVMRLIRSEMEWIHSEHLRDNPDAQQLQRDFYRIPKPSNLHQRNVFLREFAFRGAQLLQSSIPMATLQDFRASPRTTASIVASLGRASMRARQQLAPLQDLKREASNAKDLKDAHDFSGAYDLYTALAGEVEARNTQTRQSMNDEQRKASSPWVTADVSKAKTIVVYNGTEFAAPSMEVAQFSRSQPADAIASSMGQMTQSQERAYRAVAGFDKVPTLKERFDSFKANMGLRMKQALVDQFAPIAQLDQNAYMLARMSKGSDGTLDAALLYGRPFLRDGVPDVDVKEGGFAKVLADLKGEHDRFLMWVAAQRAEGLKEQGKENLFSDQDIASLQTLNDGQMQDGSSRKQAYAKALMQLNSFNESVLRMAKESGLIDQDAYDLMRDQPYVPFYRLMEEEGGLQGPSFSKGLTNQKAWKKLKGGTEQLNADLLQNMLLNWGNLYAASARNRAALATMDAADKMAVAYKVPSDTKGAAKVMRDGMTEHWMVEDPYLLEAISALHYQASPLMKPLAKAKQWLTIGVTVNPTFKVRNLIRDVVSSMAMADLSYNPAANVANGWKLTARDSQVYASMLASGGVIKFGTQEQTDRARKQVAKLSGVVLDQNGAKKLWGQVKALYAVYDDFGDRTENINRAALYDRLIKNGHSHADASFMARDLMDFSMGGNATVVRFLTQSVPFLNARMQGLYKLGRAAKEDPRRFATVAMAVSVASLGLLAAYADDEDWKRREDWDRDSYWWFKIGETAYRIPKPFEVGAIGTLAERTAEAMFDDEMDSTRFMGRISHMVSQTFAFDPVPQAFKPLLDIYSNKDSFTGRAIESQADQRLRPEDRHNERTSEVARFLGQMGLPDPAQLVKGEYTGLSPKQIDHLLRGYFSWIATAATTASDSILRNTVVERGESPDLRLKDAFLAGNFMETLPTGGSRYVSAMYEQSRAVEQAYASYRDALASGDQDGAAAILESDGGKIRSRASVATATKLLAQLNAQAKRIQADTQLDGSEKRERLTQIEQRRHEVAKRVMGGPAT